MHMATAILCGLVTVLYGYRSGALAGRQTWDERLARLGIGLVLITVCVGFLRRASAGDPFLWTHWLVAGALLITFLSYVALVSRDFRRPQ